MLGYIYALRLTDDTTYRYVGLTRQKLEARLWQHRNTAANGSELPVSRWIRKHGGDAIEILLIEECDLAVVGEREKFYISYFESLGHPLLNITIGGGTSKPTTDEIRRNCSEAQRRRTDVRGGKPLSDAHRKKLSEALKGRVRSDEERMAISNGRKGIKFTDEHIENLRTSHLNQRRLTDEQINTITSSIYRRGIYTELANQFGVSPSLVSRIAREANGPSRKPPTSK
jgi:hypothetical protein